MASTTTSHRHSGISPAAEMPSLCTVEVRTSKDSTVVSVAGEVDVANVHELAQNLTSDGPTDVQYLVVDLSALEFIEVMGLRVLLDAKRRAQLAGRGFTILNSPAHMRNLLRLTQTSHLLDHVSPSEPAAAVAGPGVPA